MDKGEQEIYLVTATHVASTCNGGSVVVISDANGNATTLRLVAYNSGLTWRHHPVADISVLPIQMSAIIQPHMTNRFFPFDQATLGRN